MMIATTSDNTFLLISTSFDEMKYYFVDCLLNAITPFLTILYFNNIKITAYSLLLLF